MATITVYPEESPRYIFISSTENAITQQELLNLCREWEQQQENLSYPKLINSAGKEELGGGVTVGITNALQNAKIAFNPVTTSVSSGAATSINSGTELTDTLATFITDGIEPGAIIINFTDLSVATVLTIDSQNQITHQQLDDGSDNTWEIGDVYKIWNITQCDTTGGNITALDVTETAMPPILPTAFNQVVKTSSSSATLQELSAIQYSSFNGGVMIDIINGSPGTGFPKGTIEEPSSNILDALLIAATRGFNKLYVIGDITFGTGVNIDNFTIVGESIVKSTITINPEAMVSDTEFRDARITGTLDGDNTLNNCAIHELIYVNGIIYNCLLMDHEITLGGSGIVTFLNCWSGSNVGTGRPTINMGGSGRDLAMREWSGGLMITNLTGDNDAIIDMVSGHVTVDSTVSAGTVRVRGVGKVDDNSTGTAVVIDYTLSPECIAEEVWNKPTSELTQPDTIGVHILQKILTTIKFLGLK